MFERMLKYIEQRPMRERRKSKMQNFRSFLMAFIIFGNFQKFSLGIITSLSKMSLQGQLFLAGYAQSSVPGELRFDKSPGCVDPCYIHKSFE